MAVASLTMFVAMPAFLLLRFHHQSLRPPASVLRDELGLDRLETREVLMLAVIAGAALLPLELLGQLNLRWAEIPEDYLEFQRELMPSGAGELAWTLLALGVLVPIGEEVVFRGIVQQAARTAVGPIGGVLVAGLVFGVAHLLPWATLPLVVTGILLAICYEVTGSLLAPILVHIGHNLLVLGIWMQDSGEDHWPVNAASITAAAVCLVLIVVTLRALESRGNERAGALERDETTSTKS